MTKRFPIADILTVTTGALLSHDGMDGLYRILNYLTGDSLMTHQLPAAADAMRPELLTQLPWLAEVVPPNDATTEQILQWRDWAEAKHGTEHELTAPPSSIWGEHDPIQELVDTVGEDRVIAVEIPNSTNPTD